MVLISDAMAQRTILLVLQVHSRFGQGAQTRGVQTAQRLAGGDRSHDCIVIE